MGVWVSGFFGSGKSRFPKFSPYLLQNKQAGGRRALNYFKEDIKIAGPALPSDMQPAADAPTYVILFSVSSKSAQKNSILNVFLRAFYEMRGYSGAISYLTDLGQRPEKRFAFNLQGKI